MQFGLNKKRDKVRQKKWLRVGREKSNEREQIRVFKPEVKDE